MIHKPFALCAFVLCLSIAILAAAQEPEAPSQPQAGSVGGTVLDTNNDVVPGATVTIDGPNSNEHRTTSSDENGSFRIGDLPPGGPYHVTIHANGFVAWVSPLLTIAPGEIEFVKDIRLAIAGGATSVTVLSSPVEIATEQVKVEEQQRVLGVIPNFYVVYDKDAPPLTTGLKFKLALKAGTDPVTLLGVAFLCGIGQAGDSPDYREGLIGYGQRFGANFTDGFTDIMFGGAVLPSLLHQDPRYFYQGTGTKKSRALHALESPFICKGDNGKWQPNYSSVGGDLISGAISNAYYPDSNRGPGLVFENALITTGGRMVNGLVQEFLLRKLTPSAKRNDN